mgnify:CR=1 FL=1
MTERCVDASIAIKWAVKKEPNRNKARALLSDAGTEAIRLIVPPIFPTEVDSAIRKRVFDGKMSLGEARKAYAILDAAPVDIVDMPGVRHRAREIAERFNQRFVYDAHYAALAGLRGCEFWTADKIFYDAVKAGLPYVRYLLDYP